MTTHQKCTKGMSNPCANASRSEKASTELHDEHASSAASSETVPPNSGKCAAPGRLQWRPPNEPTGPTAYAPVASPTSSTIVSTGSPRRVAKPALCSRRTSSQRPDAPTQIRGYSHKQCYAPSSPPKPWSGRYVCNRLGGAVRDTWPPRPAAPTQLCHQQLPHPPTSRCLSKQCRTPGANPHTSTERSSAAGSAPEYAARER